MPNDVIVPGGVEMLFAAIEDRVGRLDLLFKDAGVNAPGVPMDGLPPARIHRLDESETGRCQGCHLWARQRPEYHPIFFESVKDDQQVRQKAAQSIQRPNDRNIASVRKRERLRQSMPVTSGARGVVFKKKPGSDAKGCQGILLQVKGLTF